MTPRELPSLNPPEDVLAGWGATQYGRARVGVRDPRLESVLRQFHLPHAERELIHVVTVYRWRPRADGAYVMRWTVTGPDAPALEGLGQDARVVAETPWAIEAALGDALNIVEDYAKWNVPLGEAVERFTAAGTDPRGSASVPEDGC